jgi:hypothetical protein
MGTNDTARGASGARITEGEPLPLELVAPIYLQSALTSCPRCSELTTVHALIATDVIDLGESGKRPSYIFGINNPPSELLRAIAPQAPHMRLVKSKTHGGHYLANVCEHCGEVQGDFHLHMDQDGPFAGTPPPGHLGSVVLQQNILLAEASYS